MVVSRDVQPCLPHEGEQAQCFQRNSFTTGVGTGNEQCGKFFAQINIDRHDSFLIQQRMSAFLDIHIAFCIEQGLCTVHRQGKLCFCENKVQLCQQFQVCAELCFILNDHNRQAGEDFFNFLPFFRLQFLDFVVQLYHAQRLHEYGRTCVGLVVYHTGEHTAVFALDRHTISVISDGDDKVLEHISICGRRNDPIQMVFHAVIGNLDFLADAFQPGTGIVSDFRFRNDTSGDFVFQIRNQCQQFKIFVQTFIRFRFVFIFRVIFRLAANIEKFPNVHQFGNGQGAAHFRPFQLWTDFPKTAKGRAAFAQHHAHRFGGFLLTQHNFRHGNRRLQVVCHFLCHRGNGKSRQHIYDFIVFQNTQCFFVHSITSIYTMPLLGLFSDIQIRQLTAAYFVIIPSDQPKYIDFSEKFTEMLHFRRNKNGRIHRFGRIRGIFIRKQRKRKSLSPREFPLSYFY